MYTYYSRRDSEYRKWKTRVANPVEKSCTPGSFVIEGKSKDESYSMRAITKGENGFYIYLF
jgi:hypothetical protein